MKRYQQSRTALGSQAFLTVIADSDEVADKLFVKSWNLIDDFENRFSRFLDSSETSRFNARAGSFVTISQEFKDLLLACKALSETSEGLFNPFILPNLQRQGYVGSWPTPTSHKDSIDYRDRASLPDISKLKIDKNQARIPINSAIDFGGIGKGYLLDLLAKYMDKHSHSRYWLSLGGDIICSGLDIDDQPWIVKVQHATEADELVGVISNEGKKIAIATSGITKRKGSNWHHIIDPRSGLSADTDILSVSVIATDAASADVYAKCLVILGSQSALDFVRSHHLKTVLIQTRAGKVYRVGGKVKVL